MYAVKEAVHGMLRTRYMTFVSMATITVALILFGIVIIITLCANDVVSKVRESEEVNIYLKDEMTNGDMLALDETIASMSEVESTKILSKEDAAKEFERLFGKDFLSSLSEYPFPRSIVVKMSSGHQMSSDLENFAQRLKSVNGVESVEYGKEWMSKLDIFFLVFIIVEAILISLVVAACILVISNTITLTVIARKEAIDIMRLVGATDSYIRQPFYFEGLIEGFISGIITFVFLYGIYYWVHKTFNQIEVYKYLFGINEIQYLSFPLLLSIIIPIGGFLGLLGSYVAVRRAF